MTSIETEQTDLQVNSGNVMEVQIAVLSARIGALEDAYLKRFPKASRGLKEAFDAIISKHLGAIQELQKMEQEKSNG
jgi:hypothetical protein